MAAQFKDVIHRQQAILDYLPVVGSKKPGLTAQQLVDRLSDHFPAGSTPGANERMIQRDLLALVKEARAVVADESVKPYGYFRAVPTDEPLIDPIEWAYLIGHVESYLAGVMPERRLETAVKMLQKPEEGVRLREDQFRIIPDTLRLLPAVFKPTVLAAILQALVEEKALKVVYKDSKGQQTRPTLHPQAAIQRGPRFYLFALKNEEDDPVRMYALHRFTRAEVMEQPARKAGQFNLDQAVNRGQVDFNNGEMARLVFLTRGYVASLLHECPLNRQQEIIIEPDDSPFDWRVTVTVPLTGQLFRWLIGCGDNIKVLEPDSLGAAIAAQAAKVAALYSA
jgi:predicted DNA-binding transcriptional regulator YafY